MVHADHPERVLARPCRARRMRMSCSVLSSAWPMWSEPVTLGGGMTMVKGSASGRSGRNRPRVSQCSYHLASIGPGSKVLASSVMEAPVSGVLPPSAAAQPASWSGAADHTSASRRGLAPPRNPRNLALHMLVDHRGQMLVEPLLEQRAEHLADHVLERIAHGRRRRGDGLELLERLAAVARGRSSSSGSGGGPALSGWSSSSTSSSSSGRPRPRPARSPAGRREALSPPRSLS